MSLDDINDRLGTNLESEDYDSLGGLIIGQLDRLAEEGDEVCTADGIRMVVEKLDKNRVESVHVYLPEPQEESETQNSDAAGAGQENDRENEANTGSDTSVEASKDSGDNIPDRQ